MGRRSSRNRSIGTRSGGKPVKTETGITLTGVNADNYRKGMSNNPPGLTGVFPSGRNRVKTNKAAKSIAGKAKLDPSKLNFMQGAALGGGIQAPQPLGEPMSIEKQAKLGQAVATAQAAQGAQLQKDFMAKNPNAPKMPAGIGIAGAPANTGKMMAPEGYKPQQASMPGTLMGSAQPRPNRGKGGQSPTGGKGAMRPSPRPNVPTAGSGATPQSMPTQSSPRPRPNMSRGGKGGQSPTGGGKGGRRPSPSMGRPNPAASLPANTLASRMADGSAGPASPYAGMQPGGASDAIKLGSAMAPDTAPMMKKAPAFRMRSAHNTTFKEMGSSNKKSTPTRKTSTGYKMPGYGKR